MSTAPAVAPPRRSGLRIPGFAQLQRLGKSLMLPIALLPAAGILLRLGQPDLLGRIDAPVIGAFFEAMSAAGGAIFANLPLLFAVGVAIGFARKADGSTALSAVAGYLVIAAVFETMSPVVLEGVTDAAGEQAMINYSVFGGIVVGLVTAYLFDRYHTIQLPAYLGFFGGRRFVPIVVSLACLFLGFALSWLYPLFASGLTGLGQFIGGAGALGAFAYGFVNRMLIPLGLHHIVNTYVWFIYGDYEGANGAVTGELTRFAAGDPSAGLLTAGFYPILMFGLPGAALAMIHVAKAPQRKVAVGILSAAGLTAFLTGITEPLEFAFMFVAFPLYVIHALLTGLSLAIAYLLDIHLGFSFSAGLIDLLLYGTAPAAQNIPLLLVMGVAFFALYYVMFRFAILRWNMRTPGREPDEEFAAEEAANLDDDGAGTTGAGTTGGGASGAGRDRADQVIAAFGGRENLLAVDACITRLRIEVADKGAVDKARLRALGAAGVIEVGNNVQAVFGTQADALKTEINAALAGMAGRASSGAAAAGGTSTAVVEAPPAPAGAGSTGSGTRVVAPLPGRLVPLADVPDATFAQGVVGHGVAIDPPREDVVAVAPVSGTVVKLWPHAYVVLTADKVGVLVHLGIDTVKLQGEGFTTLVAEGARVEAGDAVVRYDVRAVEALGRNPIVPVVVMDAKADRVSVVDAATSTVAALADLLTVRR
jgi:N-acetylglucosamine PTS system EIICBA or EIICB component